MATDLIRCSNVCLACAGLLQRRLGISKPKYLSSILGPYPSPTPITGSAAAPYRITTGRISPKTFAGWPERPLRRPGSPKHRTTINPKGRDSAGALACHKAWERPAEAAIDGCGIVREVPKTAERASPWGR
jgi:hypothetical protein